MSNSKEFIKKFMALKQWYLTECLSKYNEEEEEKEEEEEEEKEEEEEEEEGGLTLPPYFTEQDSADIDRFSDECAKIIDEKMWVAIEKAFSTELDEINRGFGTELLFEWDITVPYLYRSTCPFCILSQLENQGMAVCGACDYGERHGICDRWAGTTSDYQKNFQFAKKVRARKSMSSTNEKFRQAVMKLLKDYKR